MEKSPSAVPAIAPPAGNLPEYTVSEISVALKRTVEDAYGQVRVRGEISGFKRAASGHLYFTLKDADAVLDAVCWRGASGRLAIAPEDGMEVIASGRITTYAGRSKYQIVVEALELAGEGALLKLLEERRKKLAAEGLFDQDRKRPLPYLPEVIGVVTSPTGAVIRDILHRLAERCPRHVLIWPTLVQGEGAAEQVAAAIEGFNRLTPGGPVPRPDLLIVARGGGSLEDLWAFNEEIVVRAAAASEIPLISAVGHETDTTLIDYASDLRAPTPTAAAEIAVPVRAELMADILDSARRMIGAVNRLVDERRLRVEGLARGLPEPKRLLESAAQMLDDRAERLANAARTLLRARHQEVERLGAGLNRRALLDLLERGRETLAGLGARLPPSAERLLAGADERVKFLAQRLEGLSYEKILKRGFALVRDAGDRLVASAAAARPGMDVRIGFHDGEVAARVAGPVEKKTPAIKKKKKPDPSDGGAQGSLL